MYTIGRQALSQINISSSIATSLKTRLNWDIKLYHKSGGLKKQWRWGGEKTPFKSIEFELNKKLMGAGSFELNYLDFPIHAGDYFEIYFKNDLKYRALVESAIDPKGGKVKLIPYSQQFQELLINNSFTSKTVSEIFQTIIESIDEDTGIIWHDFYIDTNSTEVFTIDYSNHENPRKIFDDLIKNCNDREWGVNQYNIFSVYEQEDTVSKNLLNTDQPFFESIEEKIEYSGIKTRYQVDAKVAGTSEVTNIGQVGYGGNYPILTDIEAKVRKQIEKYAINEVISDPNEALDIAYANLVYQAQISNPVSIKGLDPTLYFPIIGKKIKAESSTEKVMKIICDCDSVIGWSGYVSEDIAYYTSGDGSIKISIPNPYLILTILPTDFVFDLGEYKRYLYAEKIGFMLRASASGDYLEFSTARYRNGVHGNNVHGVGIHGVGTNQGSDYLWETTKKIHVASGNCWFYYEFNLADIDFRYIGFRLYDLPGMFPLQINIDEIQLYTYTRNIYEGKIVSAKFKMDSSGIKCDLEINDYNKFANDQVFANEKKIRQLEVIANAD
jgi:hypothetical protein